MSNKPKHQADGKPQFITLDLSPQERNKLMAVAVRNLLKEAVMEAKNNAK